MTWNDISNSWKAYRPQIKEEWPKLTDDDLDKIRGNRATLVSTLSDRHGLEQAKAEKEVDAFCQTVRKPASKLK